jgi:glycosyltransferase involved in cell wall biosynthesis
MNNPINQPKSHKQHCMVVHAYYPVGETRVEREALALVDRGYQVDVICLRAKGEPAQETIDGINVFRLPVGRHKGSGLVVQLFEYMAFLVMASIKLAASHRDRLYGVVQLHNLPDWLVFAGLAPKLAGARLILDLHDLMPEFYSARFNTNLASWPARVMAWQEQLSCRFADHVITVTEPWRQTLIQRGVPASKCSVVMNVADDRIFHRGGPAAASHLAQNGSLKLIYHGNLTQRYGIDLAIRAVALVRKQIPHIQLIVHGWGDYRQELVNLANELDLGEHVLFSTRALATSELPDLIRSADVGVVPYRRDVFTDGILPTKLMEYTALGLPVIAANTPAILAYFDETMVQYFTPDDPEDLARCILALSSDRQRLAHLALESDRFNQQYNWARVSAEYVALVERLGAR